MERKKKKKKQHKQPRTLNETQRILIDSFIKAFGINFKGFPFNRIVLSDFNSAIELGNSFNLFPPNQRVLSDSISPIVEGNCSKQLFAKSIYRKFLRFPIDLGINLNRLFRKFVSVKPLSSPKPSG